MLKPYLNISRTHDKNTRRSKAIEVLWSLKMVKRFILFMIFASHSFSWVSASTPSEGLPITHVLMSQFSWTVENFGPPGQRYRLDIADDNKTPILAPHSRATNKSAPLVTVCSIFSPGNKVLFSSEGLKPQQDPLRQQDQDAWKNYIQEGTSKYALAITDVTDQWLSIKKCQFPDMTVANEKGNELIFPLLVLADPDSVWITNNSISQDYLDSAPPLPTAEDVLADTFPMIPKDAFKQWMRAIQLMGSKLYIWYGIPEEALPKVIELLERWNGQTGTETQQWLDNIALKKILTYCDSEQSNYEMGNCTKVFQGSLAKNKAEGLQILNSLP